MMGDLMIFAASLFRKLKGVNPETRERIKSFLEEFRDNGAIPLGLLDPAVARGEEARSFYWVVYDRSRFASDSDMRQYLQRRTPPGYFVAVLDV